VRLDATTVRLGPRRLVVARPNEHQYGHLGLEIVMSLARAREQGADVYLLRPTNALGVGLFELESPEVRVLRPKPLVTRLLQTCVSWQRVQDRIGLWRHDIQERVEREFVREVDGYIADEGLPPPIRKRLRGTRRRLRTSLQQITHKRQFGPPYYERRLLRDPVTVRLRPTASDEAARQARAHGIETDARLVCVHAREAGYKRGQELHDTKPLSSRDDQVRNAHIESYFEAIDYLVQCGYTVVRLGDPSMAPVRRPGVIDLATSPARTNLLEIYCMLHSAFVLAGESAYVGIACVTNTPLVLVNVTEPISGYPIRAPGLFLPKGVVDRRDNRRLTSTDLLTLEYQRQVRDTRRYEYLSNTPEEILEVTREMVDWVEGRWAESPAQRRYHEAIMTAAAQLRRHSAYVRKWGLHRGFLGDGRIARVAA
jgi:putative glycosyltransferase (TIGR04372 family)